MGDIIDTQVNALFNRIKTIIDVAQQNIFNAINQNMLATYWSIGMLIIEDEQGGKIRAKYGRGVLMGLSERLTAQYGKGYSATNLRYFRQFYLAFPPIYSDKVGALVKHHNCDESEDVLKQYNNAILQFSNKLTWSHYRLLMRISNLDERKYYINESITQMWSMTELERQINSFYYRRQLSVPQRLNEKLPSKDIQKATDIMKDPFVLEFTGITPQAAYTEKQLEQSLIDNLQIFLLELGKGFSFVARQQRISTETSNFYIDLTFYNYLLKCFVIIDLKIGKLTHQDIGQMDMYVRMFDGLKRNEGDNPTIGLILCSEKEETVVKYSVLAESKQLFASKYMLYLPSEEELAREIERERVFYSLKNDKELK